MTNKELKTKLISQLVAWTYSRGIFQVSTTVDNHSRVLVTAAGTKDVLSVWL